MGSQREIVLVYLITLSSLVFFVAVINGKNEELVTRALPVLVVDNSRTSLSHVDKVISCAQLSAIQRYKAFGLRNNGECWSGINAISTYARYGNDSSCLNGTGGVKANDVYLVDQKVIHYGCFKEDPNNRAMPVLVANNTGSDVNKFKSCARATWRMGFTKAFGLWNGGECWSGINVSHTYNMHGESNECRNNSGGPLAIDVYFFDTTTSTTVPAPSTVTPTTVTPTTVTPKTVEKNDVDNEVDYQHIGCFKDTPDRAMSELVGNWRELGNASIKKCADASWNKGYKAFGVQNSGECWSGVNAGLTYDKCGNSTKCSNGIGGAWANDVYVFFNNSNNEVNYRHIGCFKDKGDRAMPELVGNWRELGNASIKKCADASWNKEYKAFGVQDWGECWSGVNAGLTYDKYGISTKCSNGIGGDWANDVYVFYICRPGYSKKPQNRACQPCPVNTYKEGNNSGNCKDCGWGSTWGRKAVISIESCTAENPIKVSNFVVNIVPADVKPGSIVANFNASYTVGSLVIPPLTYTITGVTKHRLVQPRTINVASDYIDSCSQPASNSSFPFCIYKHNGSIATNKNFNCSEGDRFVISINVSDSGNDTIGTIVNTNGRVTIACVDMCKGVKPLYEKARNACPKSTLTMQTNGTRQLVVANSTNIHTIYEIHVTHITDEGWSSFNVSMKYGMKTSMVYFRDIAGLTNIPYRLDTPIIVTGPVINITLLSNGNITPASLTLVFVPKHPENCTADWTCLDAVFNWTTTLNVAKCGSDPDNLRMRYGHCVVKPNITSGPQPWRGTSRTQVKLSCNIASSIPARITWYREANIIVSSNVTMNVSNQGYYWCEASNRYGTAQSAKALLVVTDYFTSFIKFKTKKNYPMNYQSKCQPCEQISGHLFKRDELGEYKNGRCREWNWNNKLGVECIIYGKTRKQDINVYYDTLINILTEGRAKNNRIEGVKIYWKTISVKDAGICRNETTGNHNVKGVFTWGSVRIGETSNATCPKEPSGSSATRTCGGDFNTGATWNTPDDDNCEYKSQKTEEMNKISKVKVNSGNAKKVAKNFTKLLKSGSAKDLSEADATLAADMVDKIVSIGDKLNETADMVIDIIDTMMEMNATSLPANASTKIIKALNKVAEKIPLEEGTTSRVLNSTNLAIQANEVNPTSFPGIGFGIKKNEKDGSSVVTSADQSSLFVKLPNTTLKKSNNLSARIGFIYFANHNLFQEKPNDEDEDEEVKNKKEPSKEVLSSSVYNTNTSSLLDNVTLKFPMPKGKSLKNSSCVFWNVNERQWSDEGCWPCNSNNDEEEDSIECCCNHLTSFAVLFSPEGKPLSGGENDKHARILSIISYVGCGISLAGVVLTFLTYSLFRHLRKTNQQPILMNLCVAIALLLIVFAVGVESTSNLPGCQIVAGLLHYLTLVTVFWMGIEAYNLYLQLVKVMAIYYRKFMLKASLVAWGVPAIIVIATVVAAAIEYNANEDSNRVFYYGNENVCILHNQLYRMISWFAPVLAILIFNLVMFVLVIYKLNCTGAMVPADTKSNQRRRCWTAIALMSLVGVTWLFGAFAISGARVAFEYLFCIFNSLQGFFIFFFHCIRLKAVRNQWSFFASGLGFSHKESEYSNQRSRGIGESHHSSEAPYLKVKNWILRKESDADQPKRKTTMVTVVDDKHVNGSVCDDYQIDIELDEVKNRDNDALDESFTASKRQESQTSQEFADSS